MDSLTQRLRMTTASDAANMPTTVRDDCHAAAARIAALEAQLAEMTRGKDYWKIEAEGERAKVERRDRQLSALEVTPPPRELTPAECDMIEGAFLRGVKRSLTTPPAPKVTEEMIEAGHAAMMSELFLVCQPDRVDVFSFMYDHPEIIQIVLTAAQEAGKL